MNNSLFLFCLISSVVLGSAPGCLTEDDPVVACAQNLDCPAKLPVCEPELGGCTPCELDAQCLAHAQTPHCDGDTGQCVQCNEDAQCGQGLCLDHGCVEGCRSDAHCGGDTPVCDTDARRCVQCLEHAQCSEDSPVCKDQVCVPGCLDDADCTAPEAARCSPDHECIPCNDSVQCLGVPGRELCEAGSCVECTVNDESACGNRSCDPLTLQCSQTVRGSIGVCGPCRADSECGDAQDQESDAHRCIALEYDGLPQGGRCLQLPDFASEPPCPRPYGVPIERSSLSQVPETIYCGINEELTTCEAVLAGSSGLTCPSGMPIDCAPEGALCEAFGIAGHFCTYPCEGSPECPESLPACQGGFCTFTPTR